MAKVYLIIEKLLPKVNNMEDIRNHLALSHESFPLMAPPAFDLTMEAMQALTELIQSEIQFDDIDPDILEELADKQYVGFTLDYEGEIKEFLFAEDLILAKLDNLYNNYLRLIR